MKFVVVGNSLVAHLSVSRRMITFSDPHMDDLTFAMLGGAVLVNMSFKFGGDRSSRFWR